MDDLQRLSEKYLSIYPVRDINFESLFPASLDYYSCLKQQQDILSCTVFCATALKYFPHQPYRKSFLKAIINQLEKNGHEVDEELYLAYTNLLQISNSSDEVGSKYSYTTYTLRDRRQVTLKETSNLIAEGTTGLRTWQASHVLLDYLLDRPSFLDGMRVLELGAGLGLLGIGLFSSRCPPSHYTLTDLHPTVLDTLKHNISINLPGVGRTVPHSAHARLSDEIWEEVVLKPSGTAVTVDVKRLDWDDEDQLKLLSQETPYDLILAADVVFDPSLYWPLLRTISSCLNVSLPSNCTLSKTTSSSGAPGRADSITGCSQREGSGECNLNEARCCEPEHFSKTDAAPALDSDDLSSVDISIKCDPTSHNRPALLSINGDDHVESLTSDVCLPREERRGVGSQCSLVSRSYSKNARPIAILAATVRNKEALDSFLSLLGVHGLSVVDEIEKVYQQSPSQPEHSVRILHLEATTR